MFKKLILIVTTLLFLLPDETAAQIGGITTFSPGQTISSSAMNANLSLLASNACNRAACVMTGAMQGTSATFSSTLAVTGAVTLSSTLSVSGASTLAAVASGAITASGNIAPATGATYNSGGAAARWLTVYTGALDASGDILDSTGNVTINDALDVSGAVTLSSTLAVTGNVTLSGLLTASGSTAGGRQHTLINTSSGTSSFIDLRLQNDAGNSAAFQYLSSTFTGLNNAFLISNTGNGIIRFVTTGGFEFTSGRVNTNTSQPGFLCYNAADDTVTAPGATMDCDTEVYDNTNSFTGDTFTAPVTGQYELCVVAEISGVETGAVDIVTSNRTYRVGIHLNSNNRAETGCVFADMDAADTALVNIAVNINSNTLEGSASPLITFFSARLVL